VPRTACAIALLFVLVAGEAPGSAAAAPAPAPALFGTVEAPAGPDETVPQWQDVLRELARERAVIESCHAVAVACPSRAAAEWLRVLDGLAGRPPLEQLRGVNAFVNRWTYRTDAENYGRSDRWATPLRFFRRSGDCEDYAIAKYVSLRRLGFAPERLRLVVLHDAARDLAHAVLAVFLDDGVRVLDNLAADVLPQQQLTHYQPYYSLNEVATWLHTAPEPRVAAIGIGGASAAPAGRR